jgi:general secretion pathway protein H
MRERFPEPAGFTLIEMMVVLVILGLSMTAVPAIVAGIDGSRLRAASDDVIARLREARNQAIRTEAPVEVVLDMRRRSYRTSFSPDNNQMPDIVSRVEVAPASLADPNGIVRIRFQPDGSATPVRLALWRRGGSSEIAIDGLSGRVGAGG